MSISKEIEEAKKRADMLSENDEFEAFEHEDDDEQGVIKFKPKNLSERRLLEWRKYWSYKKKLLSTRSRTMSLKERQEYYRKVYRNFRSYFDAKYNTEGEEVKNIRKNFVEERPRVSNLLTLSQEKVQSTEFLSSARRQIRRKISSQKSLTKRN